MPNGNGHGCIAQWAYSCYVSGATEGRRWRGLTRWGHTIVFEFIILGTVVGGRNPVLAAKLLFTMLTFVRQKVDEVAVLSGALVSDREEPSRRFRCCSHGW